MFLVLLTVTACTGKTADTKACEALKDDMNVLYAAMSTGDRQVLSTTAETLQGSLAHALEQAEDRELARLMVTMHNEGWSLSSGESSDADYHPSRIEIRDRCAKLHGVALEGG